MRIPYRKYHGTGNDFAVVEAATLSDPAARSRFGMALCAELDADGVLFLADPDDTDPPQIEFTLYQPDGSTADMCGNGARVAARWAMERTGGRTFVLDTPAGPRHSVVHDDESVTVEMGVPTFEPADVPVDSAEPVIQQMVEGFEITAVNTGVPHAVAFVDDVDAIDIEAVAPPIRHADIFPDGANATFAQVAPENSNIDFRQRTFERGVEGETQSCGTGAVGIAAVAGRLGMIDPGTEIRVRPPGGVLTVSAPTDGQATLEGPTAFEFEDEYDFERDT